MNALIFMVRDAELQGFYTGITVSAAITLLFISGDLFGNRRFVWLAYSLPIVFTIVRVATRVSFGRLSYAGLAVFIAAVFVQRAAKRARGAR